MKDFKLYQTVYFEDSDYPVVELKRNKLKGVVVAITNHYIVIERETDLTPPEYYKVAYTFNDIHSGKVKIYDH